jgi:hypothetical protein
MTSNGKACCRGLIVEQYKLTFHHEKKELPVYVLSSLTKSGQKMTKSDGDPNGLPGLFFRGRLGDLTVRNANGRLYGPVAECRP